MSKAVKNVTELDITIQDVGVTLSPNILYPINPTEYDAWAASVDIDAFITSGDIEVYDSHEAITVANGRTIQEAINFIKYPDYALNQRFLNDDDRSNGFVSTTTQEAIEELVQNYKGSIAQHKFVYLGGISNKYLGNHVPQIPSNEVPDYIILNSWLMYISFNNNIVADCDVVIRTRMNGDTNYTDKYTWEVRNIMSGVLHLNGSINFSADEQVAVFIKFVSNPKPSDVIVGLYITPC